MLTTEATPERIAEWKKIFEDRHAALRPNRRSGAEVDAYFRASYPHQIYDSAEFRESLAAEIMENDFLREKLPEGKLPRVQCYTADEILIGIDLISGAFHIEGEDIGKVSSLYDDLFAFRGLDSYDLNNFFLVAEYVKLTEE